MLVVVVEMEVEVEVVVIEVEVVVVAAASILDGRVKSPADSCYQGPRPLQSPRFSSHFSSLLLSRSTSHELRIVLEILRLRYVRLLDLLDQTPTFFIFLLHFRDRSFNYLLTSRWVTLSNFPGPSTP